MTSILEEQLKVLRNQTNLPSSIDDFGLEESALKYIFQKEIQKDSFYVVEELKQDLADEAQWQRRRLAWKDNETGEDLGLCINFVRLGKNSTAGICPSVAMAHPGLIDFEAIENAYWQTVWATGAIRTPRGTKHPRLYLNMRELTCAKDAAPRGPWEDLMGIQQKVEEGSWDDTLTDLIPMMKPTFVDQEDGDLEVARYLPAYAPSWSVQADSNVLVATNAGYFLNFPEEYEDGMSALHQPIGALHANGRLHMPPWIMRPCAVEWVDGVRGIELLGPENLALSVEDHQPFHLVHGPRMPDAIATIWRHFDDEMPILDESEDAVDLVFSGVGLAKVVYPGSTKPPFGGAIIRLKGAVAAPWLAYLTNPKTTPFPTYSLKLLTSREKDLVFAIAGGPRLLHDGHLLSEDLMFNSLAAGEFYPEGPAPTRFPYDATKTRAPRTALGITPKEEWVLVVVDGRADPTHSVGCTLEELARLMQRLGCYRAVNFDGGGSSVMSIEGLRPIDQLKPGLASTVANIPSDVGNRERIVPVCINITKNTTSTE